MFNNKETGRPLLKAWKLLWLPHGMGTAEECAILKATDFKEKPSLDLCVMDPIAGAKVKGSYHLHRLQSRKAIEVILENPCNRIPLFTPASS